MAAAWQISASKPGKSVAAPECQVAVAWWECGRSVADKCVKARQKRGSSGVRTVAVERLQQKGSAVLERERGSMRAGAWQHESGSVAVLCLQYD